MRENVERLRLAQLGSQGDGKSVKTQIDAWMREI